MHAQTVCFQNRTPAICAHPFPNAQTSTYPSRKLHPPQWIAPGYKRPCRSTCQNALSSTIYDALAQSLLHVFSPTSPKILTSGPIFPKLGPCDSVYAPSVMSERTLSAAMTRIVTLHSAFPKLVPYQSPGCAFSVCPAFFLPLTSTISIAPL